MKDLIGIFDSISPPKTNPGEANTFKVRGFGIENIWLGRSAENHAVFLVELGGDSSLISAAEYELKNLLIQHQRNITLILDDENRHKTTASLVQCCADERDLRNLFLETVGHSLAAIREFVTEQYLIGLITHLVELFRAVERPGEAEVLGLWGELLAISVSENPELMCESWHPRTSGRADFSSNDERLEIKTTQNTHRRHSVSFEQANPPQEVTGAIASIQTEEIGDGLTLGELWDRCRGLMVNKAELCQKVDKICVSALGANWTQARGSAFDHAKAIESFEIFSVNDIPRFEALPRGVNRVRFESDMTNCPGLQADGSVLKKEGLINSVLRGLAS